jgi:formiminoglutamase
MAKKNDPQLEEIIQFSTYSSLDVSIDSKKNNFIVFGCPDDLGIKYNLGRPGAKEGPQSIRKFLYKKPLPHKKILEKLQIFDHGDIAVSDNILQTHANSKKMAAEAAKTNAKVIPLGGGHDFAGPNFLGFVEGSGKKKFGVVNIDSHLDVRVYENDLPNSGTGFREILESGHNIKVVQFGTRVASNSQYYLDYCKQKKVEIHYLEDIKNKKLSVATQFKNMLQKLATKVDLIGVSLDMDSCHEICGVSAQAAVGFTAFELLEISKMAALNKKVKYFEVAETSPPLDFNDKTSKLSAEIIYNYFINCTL